jgi:CRP-like cAMP-binding protein
MTAMTGSTAMDARQRLLTRLGVVATLGEEERAAIAALPITVREVEPGEDIVREGDRTQESCVVIDGFLQRHKDLRGGGRQILAFHVPGDVPDLQSLHLPLMDHTLSAVSPSAVGLIPHTALHILLRDHPGAGVALWREGLIDAARLREWIVNLGSRAAPARLAHLFCELYVRNRTVGLGGDGWCFLPLTQTRMGEAMGLSMVHVSRVTKVLREQGLVEVRGRELHILDWPGLQRVAEFDPAYLHLHDGGEPQPVRDALGA